MYPCCGALVWSSCIYHPQKWAHISSPTRTSKSVRAQITGRVELSPLPGPQQYVKQGRNLQNWHKMIIWHTCGVRVYCRTKPLKRARQEHPVARRLRIRVYCSADPKVHGSPRGSANKGAAKHKAEWILQKYRTLGCRPRSGTLPWTTKIIMFVGSSYKTLHRAWRRSLPNAMWFG